MRLKILTSNLIGRFPRWFAGANGVSPTLVGGLRLLIFGLTALLAQTFFWSSAAPAALKLTVGGIAVVSAIRPDVGLFAVALLTPFGRVIGNEVFDAYPAHFTEAIVLAFLAGWLLSRLRQAPDGRRCSLASTVSVLLAATVAASSLVDVIVLRQWKDYWWPYVSQVAAYLSRGYLGVVVSAWPSPAGLEGAATIGSAVLLLEGIALLFAVRQVSAERRTFLPRLVRVLIVAAAGTALLSVLGMVRQALADAPALGGQVRLFTGPRLAVHTPKVNTAASSFVLFLPIVFSLLIKRLSKLRKTSPSPDQVVGSLAEPVAEGALLCTALWLTGSRSGLVAVLLVAAVVTGGWIAGLLRQRVNLRRLAVPFVLIAIAGGIVGFAVYQKAWRIPRQASLTVAAVRIRQLGLLTSVRMLRDAPVFGIGIGRYYVASRTYTPEAVEYAMERPFNAHNQFLQVAAELGLVGLVLFAALLGLAWYRGWVAFRRSRDSLLGGVLAGLAAFIFTSLAGQPLLIEVVAYPFWLTLGVALAYGDRLSAPTDAGVKDCRASRLVVAACIAALAVSVPVRASQAADDIDLSVVSYGFSRYETGSDGEPYRVIDGRGTFFLPSNARRLDLPVRPHRAQRQAAVAEVLLDGRLATRLSLLEDRWETVSILIPPKDAHRFRRVDLRILAPNGADPTARVGNARVYLLQ